MAHVGPLMYRVYIAGFSKIEELVSRLEKS